MTRRRRQVSSRWGSRCTAHKSVSVDALASTAAAGCLGHPSHASATSPCAAAAANPASLKQSQRPPSSSTALPTPARCAQVFLKLAGLESRPIFAFGVSAGAAFASKLPKELALGEIRQHELPAWWCQHRHSRCTVCPPQPLPRPAQACSHLLSVINGCPSACCSWVERLPHIRRCLW